MRFTLFVALRYFFSKKNKGIVHIISLISLVGIGVCSMALIVVLSVFNGFSSVGEKMLSYSNPDILIESRKGKTFSVSDINISQIENTKGVEACVRVFEETVMMTFFDTQKVVELIGTQNAFATFNHFDTLMRVGEFDVGNAESPNAILGYALSLDMGLDRGAENMNLSLKFCSLKKDATTSIVPEENINTVSANYGGSFMTAGDMDVNTVFVPLSLAQELSDYDSNTVSGLYVFVKQGENAERVKERLQDLLPQTMVAKNRLEQEPAYFKIVKSEKLAVYLILSFIVFIASFNVMGSVSLFAMIKQNDIKILTSMGASKKRIRSIFFALGLTLSSIGCIAGLLLGSLFCLLQQCFGFVKTGAQNLVIDAFPIGLQLSDIASVILLVGIISMLCVGIMVKRIKCE